MTGTIQSTRKAAGQDNETVKGTDNSTSIRGWAITFVSVVAFVLLSYALLGGPVYETSDDVGMSMVSAGLGFAERPDDHLLYTSFIIGRCLNAIYSISPDLPWYALYLLASQTLAMVVIIRLLPGRGSLLIPALFLLSCLRPVEMLQFTTTAALVASAGSLLLLTGAEHSHKKGWILRFLFPALMLFALSALIRHLSTYLILLLTALVVVVKSLASLDRRKLLIGLLSVAAAAALTLTLSLLNGYHHSKGEWKNFYRMTHLHYNLFETGRTKSDSPETKAAIKKAGWSANDIAMFNNWFSLDPDLFNPNKLARLDQILPQAHNKTDPLDVFLQLKWLLADITMAPMLLVIALAIPCLKRSRFSIKSSMIFLTGIAGLLIFFIVESKLPPRLVASVLGYTSLIFLWCISPRKLSPLFDLSSQRKSVIIGLCLALLLIPLHDRYKKDWVRTKEGSTSIASALSKLDAKKENLYFHWPACLPLEKLLPFDNLRQYFLPELNLVFLGSDPALIAGRLKRRGIDNFVREIDRPGVFVISNAELNKLMATYIAEHHHKKATFQLLPEQSQLPLQIYKSSLSGCSESSEPVGD
jgi:hypothetical protein